MTAELLGSFPVDQELLHAFRSEVAPLFKKQPGVSSFISTPFPELYYEKDVQRFENDDLYAHKFLAHQAYLDKDYKNLIERATKMVDENFKWRKEFGVQDIKREELPDEFFDRKGCIYLKEDRDGRQVVIIKVNKLRKTRPGEKEIGERFLIYWLENIYQKNNYGITIIIDCTGAGLSNVNMDMVEFANFVFRRHYPCFLGYFLVYNLPWLLEAVWNIIKRFLPQSGIDRIKFVDQKTILEYVESDKLPEFLGGNDKSEFKYHESLVDTALLFQDKIEESSVSNALTIPSSA